MDCNISGIGPPSSNFSDPCVNNAGIGSVYINTSNRDVYIRTKISIPSLAGDFESICSVIDTCTQVDASVVAFDDSSVPVNCNTVINGTTVQQALTSLACAIRVPLLNIMEYSYAGGCILTTSEPTNLQDLFDGLLCRDEEILAKTFGWGIQGDATRTIAEGATSADVLMRTGNTVIGTSATVVANAKFSVNGNTVIGDLSTAVLSGTNNVIIGGGNQTIGSSSSGDAIVGGNQHWIQNASARSVIVGGEGTIVFGVNNGVFAGLSQTVSNGATQAAIIGGTSNTVSGTKTAVVGGQSNTGSGTNSAVVGGQSNQSGGTDSVILGGDGNIVEPSSFRSAIIASIGSNLQYGIGPSITTTLVSCDNVDFLGSDTSFGAATHASEANSAIQSAIVGGDANTLDTCTNAVILGGDHNTLLASSAAILGGSTNTIGISGQNSSIIYGQSNSITAGTSLAGGSVINNEAAYSIGLGRNVHITSTHLGSFLWQCSDVNTFTSAAVNEFAIKANGGIRIRTNSAGTTGMDMSASGSSWVAVSSETVKDNFVVTNTKLLLEKLKQLDIFSYNYKKDLHSDEVYSDVNIGTTAEQWNEVFGQFFTPKSVKNSNGNIAGISYMDAIGVLLGAVKQLTLEIEELKHDNARILNYTN